MRFEKTDIIFDEDIDTGKPEEITGYLWATEKLRELADYHGCLFGEDYIYIWPSYNVKTEEFYVTCSGSESGQNFEKKMDLTTEEIAFIKEGFITYYWNDKESFMQEVDRWREEINAVPETGMDDNDFFYALGEARNNSKKQRKKGYYICRKDGEFIRNIARKEGVCPICKKLCARILVIGSVEEQMIHAVWKDSGCYSDVRADKIKMPCEANG